MAILKSGNLSLHINFKKLEDDWIAYEMSFLWKDKPIINDDIFKKGRWWDKRQYGTFLADDYKVDFLIDTLKKSIDTDNMQFWEPIEPDVKIAIYPNILFPFLKIDTTDISEVEIEEELSEGKFFTLLIFVDVYNFEGCGAYSSEGVSLHMIVEKEDLIKFIADMEEEYNNMTK